MLSRPKCPDFAFPDRHFHLRLYMHRISAQTVELGCTIEMIEIGRGDIISAR